VEATVVLGEVRDALANLDKWTAPESVSTPMLSQPGSSYIVAEPYGVVSASVSPELVDTSQSQLLYCGCIPQVLVIAPWNYPISLVLAPMVAAIAAGNAVVVKPSEISVNVSNLIAKLLPKYLDMSAFAIVMVGHCFITSGHVYQHLQCSRFDACVCLPHRVV
jgi:aldehyde dehydrogenase (NAD+)